jgi:hypothetical protein
MQPVYLGPRSGQAIFSLFVYYLAVVAVPCGGRSLS